jgi:hypothetical protein
MLQDGAGDGPPRPAADGRKPPLEGETMRTSPRRRIAALVLAALLLSMTAPLAAAPVAGAELSLSLVGFLVEWIFGSTTEQSAFAEAGSDREQGNPTTTATAADDWPTGQTELGGDVDPDG